MYGNPGRRRLGGVAGSLIPDGPAWAWSPVAVSPSNAEFGGGYGRGGGGISCPGGGGVATISVCITGSSTAGWASVDSTLAVLMSDILQTLYARILDMTFCL